MNTISVPVFVCHTSDLDPWVQELRRYRPRRNTQFRCEFWVDDQEITAGEVWRGRATTAIARAHGALLLVGERFMDSQPIQNEEWPLINERRRHGFPIVFVPIAGFDKEKLQALLCLQKLDDLIAVPPWDRPLPPSPHGVSVRVLDRIVVATLRAVSVKSEELYNTVKHSFSLEQRLGIGPTASTYLARDHNLNREVVIKCLTKIEKSDIFIQSAKRLGRIPAHSNIASTYAAHLNVDPYYCIQEFIQGQSLRRRLDGNPEGFPIDLTKKILASLCSAINHCHTLGERGLNIKPSNIILRNDDDVIFCPSSGDETVFMSKDGPDCLGPDMVYMPPEQRSLIRSVDKSKADQYRIGVLGYEMLLGPNKFASQQAYCACLPTSDTALGGSNTQVKWCLIETLRRDCPKFLSDVINRMVDLEPERRFDSVRHALREIERRDLMIEIARESYKRILNGGRAGQIEFFGHFYRSLISDYCREAKPYFERAFGPLEDDTGGKWQKQFTKLKQAVLLLLAFASLDENEEPTILTEYAVLHKEWGIPGGFYGPFGRCLIDGAVRADRGWGGRDGDLREAWTEAVKDGTEYMEQFAGADT